MPHPHDRYFRASVQGPAEQTELVATLFPAVAPVLDDATFETLDGGYVDEDLRTTQCDLVLRARLRGRDLYLYTLIEHQRRVDPMMAWRMLRYQNRIWERYVAEHPGATRLPAILPAVLYQGRRTWTAATDLRELFELTPELAEAAEPYLVRAPFRLDELADYDVSSFLSRVQNPRLQLMLVLLVYAPGNPHPMALLHDIVGVFIAVAAGPNAHHHLQAAFTYIWSVTDVPADQLRTFATTLGPHALEALMTTAELLHNTAHAEGLAEGKAEGRAETLLEQLEVKFGLVEEAVRVRVRSADTGQLKIWTTRILTATTLAEVFD